MKGEPLNTKTMHTVDAAGAHGDPADESGGPVGEPYGASHGRFKRPGSLFYSELRWPGLWVLIGVLLLGLVTVGSLMRISDPYLMEIMSRDKLVHFSVYLLLVLWFIQIYCRMSAWWLVAALILATSVGIEVFQGLMPYRQFDVYDMLANATGMLTALLLGRVGVVGILRRVETVAARLSAH
ncbi:MAG: hypothetical protein CSB44_05990 [Gammaproteobacteria bacterium]|nr:MAG: hypothetical protein CSB44_05990 [Gammaproteobacteria bacterium]PIE36085.1 MAG: hypothetical protein CSA54_04960 [Gammaproteobacteria bacterium]